jgi:hypothetical protein
MLARTDLQSRRLNHYLELEIEQALGPSGRPVASCPHTIQNPALG